MKNLLLILLALIIYLPAFALCPIDAEGESVCSMQNFKDNPSPIFQNNTINPAANNNIQTSPQQLQPYANEQKFEQIKLNKNQNPNLNCQFGLCPQNNDNQVQQK